MKTEKQIQILLLKVDPRFTFRNNFPQLATNVLLRAKLITRGEKRETLTKSKQRNNVARQVEVFCISYLAALNQLILSNTKIFDKEIHIHCTSGVLR